MNRIRRLMAGGSPDIATGSAGLAVVLAVLLIAGVATCFAALGDDKPARASKSPDQPFNRAHKKLSANVTRDTPPLDLATKDGSSLHQDLVLYYSFDDDANGNVYDESGNEHHGVTVGDVVYEGSFRGRAARFTSNRTYIVSDAPGLNMHGWKQTAVSVWIKTNRVTTYGRIISRGEVSGDTASGIALQAGSGISKASFSVSRQFRSNPPVWEKLYTSSLEPRRMNRVGNWVHLVGTFDGEALRLYVNGKLDREVEASSHNLKLWDRPEHKLVIGNSSIRSRMAWTDKYFDGLIDEVKIWRRSISDEEVARLYQDGAEQVAALSTGANPRSYEDCHGKQVSGYDETGDVLFDGMLWQTWRTEFAVRDGKLMSLPKIRQGFDYGHAGNGRSAQVMTRIGDQSWRDYRLDLDLAMLPPDPKFNPYRIRKDQHGASIIFRAATLRESWNESPGQTCYTLRLVPNGTWGLHRYHGRYRPGRGFDNPPRGESYRLAGGKVKPFADGPKHVHIEVVGNHIKAWVDDQQVTDFHDDPATFPQGLPAPAFGGIGVAWAYECMGWISNVKVVR